MVSRQRAPRHGAGELGCVFSLLFFVAALYYGVNITDDVIQRRLAGQAQALLPCGAPHFRITRGGHRNRIVIETGYTDQVNLPLFKHEFVLRPRAEEAL